MDSSIDKWSRYTNFIEKLADMAHGQLWGQYKNLVKYNKYCFNDIHESFKENYDSMKSAMVKGTEHLSRYKIISAYTKAILTHPLFSPDEDKVAEFFKTAKIPNIIRVPNETFICMMIQSLMQKYSAKVKKIIWKDRLEGKQYEFKYPVHLIHSSLKLDNGEYENENTNFVLTFIRLLYWYRTEEGPKNFPLFAFAIILFLLEMSNDCANYGVADMYYE